MSHIDVLALPYIDPARRQRLYAPLGSTLADIVRQALPPAAMALIDHVRVTIGGHEIPRRLWDRVKPQANAAVVVRVVPGNDLLRTILQVAVVVAAIAVGQYYVAAGLPLLFGSTAITSALVTAGTAIAGNLLINALIPVRPAAAQESAGSPGLSLRNSLNPGGTFPEVLGSHRYAPPFAITPYTEEVGDDLYFVGAFMWGYGPLTFSSHRLGDTPIEEFADYQFETRPGNVGDGALTLVRRTVLEEPIGTRLTNPKAGPEPIVRSTSVDAASASVGFVFPQGLVKFSDGGDKGQRAISVRIRYRLVGAVSWTTVTTLKLSGKSQKQTFRGHEWDFPERGRYEVEVTRMTADNTDSKILDEVDWRVLRTIRPEYPINCEFPVAISALRIKMTEQTAAVDDYNAIAALNIPDWDAGTQTWITRATESPASLARRAHQGPAAAWPKSDDEIDLAAIQNWHDFCAAKGLTYNRVLDGEQDHLGIIAEICGAGRAVPADSGEKWTVAIDRIKTLVDAHVTPANSWDFSGETVYPQLRDAFRVPFFDITNNYQQAERIVPRPGFVGSPETLEELPMPGKVHPDEVWKEARRRWYEVIHRPHNYAVMQDIEGLQAIGMDFIMLNHDVLDRAQVSGRVRAIDGNVVELNTTFEVTAGGSYFIRFRLSDGTSLRRSVVAPTVTGDTSAVRVVGGIPGVQVDDLFQFGTATRGEAIECVVKEVEAADDLSFRLTLVDHAPQIETLTDAEIPPAWDGRVGEILADSAEPGVPTIGEIEFDAETDEVRVPIFGTTGAWPATFTLAHRIAGGGGCATVTVPSGEGVAVLPGYVAGDTIEVKALATTATGVSSAYSDLVEYHVHAGPTADTTFKTADLTTIRADSY